MPATASAEDGALLTGYASTIATPMLEPWDAPDLFVRQRVREIMASRTPVPLPPDTTIEVLHLVPMEHAVRDVHAISRIPVLFSPDGTGRSRVFHDGNLGLVQYREDEAATAYTHIRRDLVVEAVTTGRMRVHGVDGNGFGRGVQLSGLESALTSSIDALARIARRGGDSSIEFRAYLSLLRAGQSWIEHGFPEPRSHERFLSDEIVLPPVLVGDPEQAGELLARYVWQAGGFAHNPAFPWEATS